MAAQHHYYFEPGESIGLWIKLKEFDPRPFHDPDEKTVTYNRVYRLFRSLNEAEANRYEAKGGGALYIFDDDEKLRGQRLMFDIYVGLVQVEGYGPDKKPTYRAREM